MVCGDLGHNQLTIISDICPLDVANLATHTRAFLRGPKLDIRIFRDPAELRRVLDDEEAQALALSSYAWNHNLSRAFAQYAKARYPSLLTVVGGPHFPLTREEQESYLRSVPEFDVASRGPTYEGERAFLNVIERYADVGCSIEGLQEEAGPTTTGSSATRWRTGTKCRVVARNISDYLGEPVIEAEEIVVETPTFSFEDYLDCRVFHLLLTIFYCEGNFEEAFAYARRHGVKAFDLVTKLHELLDEAPDSFRETMDAFVVESQDELFDTVEECEAWSREHFEQLVSGELGGNLLSKYSMLGRFFVTRAACEMLRRAIAEAIRDPRASREVRREMRELKMELDESSSNEVRRGGSGEIAGQTSPHPSSPGPRGGGDLYMLRR